jgi:hypothetical protein
VCGIGGSYAGRTLPGDLTLALEVGPSEAEYGTTVGGGPVVGYSGAQCVYDKGVADQMMGVATELDLSPQGRGAWRVCVGRVACEGDGRVAAGGAVVPADAEHAWL